MWLGRRRTRLRRGWSRLPRNLTDCEDGFWARPFPDHRSGFDLLTALQVDRRRLLCRDPADGVDLMKGDGRETERRDSGTLPKRLCQVLTIREPGAGDQGWAKAAGADPRIQQDPKLVVE